MRRTSKRLGTTFRWVGLGAPLFLALGCGEDNGGEARSTFGQTSSVTPAEVLAFPGEARAEWTFDDCSNTSSTLADSSGNGFDAVRSTGTACGAAPGDDGLARKDAVAFTTAGDVVSVAHRPAFQFDTNLTVSAWIRPNSINTTQVVVQKAAAAHQSFTLAIRNRRIEFAVELRSGVTVATSAALAANRWTHVAGLFDGSFLSLFVDGQRLGQVDARGRLRNVTAPIRIGSAAGTAESFKGRIDAVRLVWFGESEFDIARLACIARFELVSIVPPTSGPVQPETTVSYDLRIRNNNFGAACSDSFFVFPTQAPPPDFQFHTPASLTIPKGATGIVAVGVTAGFDPNPGIYRLPFAIGSPDSVDLIPAELVYELAAPPGCFVRPGRELFIKALGVVDDPVRTTFDQANNPSSGVWTFGRLMENAAPSAAAAPAMVERLFQTWLTDQTINGFVVAARPEMQNLVLATWPRTADGRLDLRQSPWVLQAIVNRIDVRNLAQGHAGEGRFVFHHASINSLSLIVEFRLLATTEADVRTWANRWHALGALAFPSESYNAALENVTRRFTGRNVAPGRPNGSALSALRTNEIALGAPWQLRNFALATTGFVPVPVVLTPDERFNETQRLANYINANEAAILQERHTVPNQFAGAPFLAGAIFNNQIQWNAPGISNPEARHKFSKNTCNGCHGPETGTNEFLMVFPREFEAESLLSPFLTGVTVNDSVTGEPRTLNDLRRRRLDLESIVCRNAGGASAPAEAAPVGEPTIALGILRVH